MIKTMIIMIIIVMLIAIKCIPVMNAKGPILVVVGRDGGA